MKPTTRKEVEALLQRRGWKLVYSDSFISPPSSFEIWENPNSEYQIRLGWPSKGDCNGATTTQTEIDKALYIMEEQP